MQYDIGDVAKLWGRFYSDAGQTTPADPSAITLKVTTPARVTTTYVFGSSDIVKESTGVYSYELPIALSDRYEFRWSGTGTVTAADEGHLLVRSSQF